MAGIGPGLGRRAGRQPGLGAAGAVGVLFSGNGFHSKEWWASGEGRTMELGKVLEPLEPFSEKMLFLRGLYNPEALIGGIHSCQTGNLLTGAHLASGGEIQLRHQLAIRSSPSA